MSLLLDQAVAEARKLSDVEQDAVMSSVSRTNAARRDTWHIAVTW